MTCFFLVVVHLNVCFVFTIKYILIMLSSLLSHPRSSQTPHPTKFIHSLSLSKQKTILQEQKNSITQKNPTKKQKETNTLTKKRKKNFVSHYQLLNASWLRIRLHINLPRSVLITLSSLNLCRQCACCFSLCDFLSPSVLLCLEGSGFLALIIILPLLTNRS